MRTPFNAQIYSTNLEVGAGNVTIWYCNCDKVGHYTLLCTYYLLLCTGLTQLNSARNAVIVLWPLGFNNVYKKPGRKTQQFEKCQNIAKLKVFFSWMWWIYWFTDEEEKWKLWWKQVFHALPANAVADKILSSTVEWHRSGIPIDFVNNSEVEQQLQASLSGHSHFHLAPLHS